ncbi:MAG: TRAP transporter large permease subunit [Pseudomonadota bacterium]
MSVEAKERYRKLSPFLSSLTLSLRVMLVILGGLYVMDIHLYLGLAVSSQQFLGLVLALGLAIIFLSIPIKPSHPLEYLPWYDIVMAVMGAACGLYVFFWYPKVANTLFFVSADKYLLSTVAIILIFEATRRLYGPVLVCITAGFIFYASFAKYFPGLLKTSSIPWEDLSTNLFLGNNGAFGYPMEVIATIVLAFIIFGALMFAAGGGSLFTDIASAALGRFRGGPAKIAVLGSCFSAVFPGRPWPTWPSRALLRFR